MSYRVVPNRTPPPLLVPIRPLHPERSSATGFVAIAGGIVIGCQMRARPLLNLPKLHRAESVTAAPTVCENEDSRDIPGETENNDK